MEKEAAPATYPSPGHCMIRSGQTLPGQPGWGWSVTCWEGRLMGRPWASRPQGEKPKPCFTISAEVACLTRAWESAVAPFL